MFLDTQKVEGFVVKSKSEGRIVYKQLIPSADDVHVVGWPFVGSFPEINRIYVDRGVLWDRDRDESQHKWKFHNTSMNTNGSAHALHTMAS